MYKNNIKRRLLNIKKRYFFKGAEILNHHGDCSVFRSLSHYGTAACTCGLLHDLKILPDEISEKLRPNFMDELLREDGIDVPKRERERSLEDIKEEERLMQIMEEVFGKTEGPSEEEIKFINENAWSLIEKVFGTDFTIRQKKVCECVV